MIQINAQVQTAQPTAVDAKQMTVGNPSDGLSQQAGQGKSNAGQQHSGTPSEDATSTSAGRGQTPPQPGRSQTGTSAQQATSEHATSKSGEPRGFVTRMWTGPTKGGAETSGSAQPHTKVDQQNQALASEATRQIARFMVQPGGPNALSSTGGDPQAGLSETSTTSASTTVQTALPALTESMENGPAASQKAGPATGTLLNPTTDAGAQENIDRVVRVLRAHVGDRESQVRLQLDPPELGRVRIDIRIRNDALFLNVETETVAGRDLLNSRMSQLREALQQHGIVVERTNVTMRDAVHEAPQAREHQQSPQQPNQNANQDAPGQTPGQSQDADQHGSTAQGDDGPAVASPADAEDSAQPGASEIDDGSGGDDARSTTESWVDLVA
jgi:flagellar hook-length control protein FliK